MRSRILYARAPEWLSLAERPDDFLVRGDFREVKNIRRNRAGFLTTAQGTVFIKRFAAGSWIEGILERLRGSPARRSLRGAEMLTRAGFSVPAPIAAGEEVSLGAIRSSWICSQALTTAQVLSRYIERGHAPAEQERRLRRDTLAAVAACVRRAHDAGLFTSDLQETNLMLDHGGGSVRIYFVDLDGFRRLARVSWRRRRRNLVQLDRSVGRFMTRSERLRFLRVYMAEQWTRLAMRQMVERLMLERERKEQEFARRRSRRGAAGGWNGTESSEPAASELSHPM